MRSDWQEFTDRVCGEFGRILKELRERANIRQSDLAEALGLQRTSIANMENGKQTPSLPQILAIAQILGVEPDDLLPAVSAPVSAHADFAQKLTPYQKLAQDILKAAAGGS